MRIAVLVSTYPPYKGGMGNVAAHDVSVLRAAGHAVTVLAPGQGLRGLRFGNACFAPWVVFKLREYDAVWVHAPFLGVAFWVALARRLGWVRRLVVTYHMDLVAGGWRGVVFALCTWLGLGFVLRSADTVLASSRDYAAAGDFARYAPDVLPRLQEIPFPYLGSAPLADAAPRGADAPFVFVGGMDVAHAFKGVPVLLQAYAAAGSGLAPLWLVGDGNLRADYEALAGRLGITERVRFLGSLQGEEYVRMLRQARCLVLPSTGKSEAYGLVLVEALWHGVPVIASDLPGVNTVARPELGILVPPGKVPELTAALLRMMQDDFRSNCSQNALLSRARFAPERYADTLRSLL